MDDVDFGAILGEKGGFFHGGIAAADHRQRLVTEDRRGAVAYSAGRNPSVPESAGAFAGAREVEALGDGAGGHDDGVSEYELGVGEDFKRRHRSREIDTRDRLGEDLSAEAEGLAAEAVGEFASEDAFGETGEVFDVGGSGELAAGGDVVGHPALEEDRLQLGPSRVYGSGVGGGAASDDAELGLESLEFGAVFHGG